MKLERLHESVLPSIALLSGLTLAIVAGNLVGSGRTGLVGALLGGLVAVGFFLFARERIWMLIPATWMLAGKVSVLPLPFSVAHLGILAAFGAFLLLKAFKIIRMKPKLGVVELWMIVMLVYLATVFLRNPVGVEALGSERVGGLPYFNVAVTCAGFWVLARSVATPLDAFFVPLLQIAGHGFETLVNVIADRFPSTVGPLVRLYSGISAAEKIEMDPDVVSGEAGRKTYWMGVGTSSFLAACSYWRPLSIINPLHFGRFLVLLFSLYAVLQSGFRTALFGCLLTFLLSSYFRRGAAEASRFLLVGALGLTALVAMQGTIFNLPLPAQRALSFLPGKWEYAAKNNAEGSTEWRVEMWKAMLTGNRYIENKWLGDGFGFTRHQLQTMLANSRMGTTAEQQENLLISGGVHSGPVSSIRYVGYVGLVIFLVLLVLVAHRAARLIRRAESTPFFALALFIGLPAVIYPLKFVFIFGAYETDLPNVILAIGFQKLLENSLDAYDAGRSVVPVTPAGPAFSAPSPARLRRPPQFAPARSSR